MAQISFRAKMVAALVASVGAAVFLTFAFGNYYVNDLQKQNVQDAVALAHEQARKFSKDLADMLRREQVGEISHDASLREKIKPLTEILYQQNKNILKITVNATDGSAIIEQSSPEEHVVHFHQPGEGAYTAPVQSNGTEKPQLTVQTLKGSGAGKLQVIKEPVERDGKPAGEVRLEISGEPAFQRIETTSHQITRALVVECVLLLAFLVAVFFALWALFSRHLRLIQTNEKLDRMAYVGTLASGLAHEIRNPLSAMNVNLEVLREDLGDQSPQARARAGDLAGRVQREITQLNSTLSSFLEFALPNKESVTTFSLRALWDELIASHEEQLRQLGITTEIVAPAADRSTIEADRRLLHQAFRNVLMNAMQAVQSSVKKHVRIEIFGVEDGMMRTIVSDSGAGIPPENLARIFDVFFSTRNGGSGFGLAIARKITEEHGGRIRAENNPEGLGARFVFDLPRESRVRAAA